MKYYDGYGTDITDEVNRQFALLRGLAAELKQSQSIFEADLRICRELTEKLKCEKLELKKKLETIKKEKKTQRRKKTSNVTG